MKCLHKISSCFLLLAGSLPVLLVLAFLIKQQVIRHQMLEKLEEQKLHSITLPAGEVHWVKKGKEIRVQGKMFDVKTVSEKNGQFTFTGLFDEEETELVRNLEQDIHHKNDQGHQLLIQLLQWMQSAYPASGTGDLASVTFQISQPSFQSIRIPHSYKSILTPPPKPDYSST